MTINCQGIKLKNIIVPLLLLVFVLLAGVLLSLNWQQFQLMQKMQGQLFLKQEEYTQAQNKLEQMKQVQQDDADVMLQLHTLAQVIPDQPQEGNIMVILAEQAKEADLQLANINFETYIQHQDYVEMPTKITLRGNYWGLLQFIDNLPGQPRHLRINQIKVDLAEQGINIIQVELLVSFFYAHKE